MSSGDRYFCSSCRKAPARIGWCDQGRVPLYTSCLEEVFSETLVQDYGQTCPSGLQERHNCVAELVFGDYEEPQQLVGAPKKLENTLFPPLLFPLAKAVVQQTWPPL